MTGDTGGDPERAGSPEGADLDLPFLQEVCGLVAGELPGVTVSFMGEGGRIVASSARERVGDLHEGAARVMGGEVEELEVTAEMAARSPTMREGITRPIVLEGRRVACLALAAPLPVARAYANIVRHWVLSSLRAKREGEKRREHLAQVERQFRDVLDFCPAALSVTDEDGRLVFHNRRLREILRYPKEEMDGIDTRRFWPDLDERQRIIDILRSRGGRDPRSGGALPDPRRGAGLRARLLHPAGGSGRPDQLRRRGPRRLDLRHHGAEAGGGGPPRERAAPGRRDRERPGGLRPVRRRGPSRRVQRPLPGALPGRRRHHRAGRPLRRDRPRRRRAGRHPRRRGPGGRVARASARPAPGPVRPAPAGAERRPLDPDQRAQDPGRRHGRRVHRRDGAQARRAGAARGEGEGGGGQPGEDRVPGGDEPRDQDAADRRARHGRPARGGGAGRRAARPRRGDPHLRPPPAQRRQRHPRLLPHRGRRPRARADRLRARGCPGPGALAHGAAGRRARPGASSSPTAATCRRWCAATRPGWRRCCSTWSATGSSSPTGAA